MVEKNFFDQFDDPEVYNEPPTLEQDTPVDQFQPTEETPSLDLNFNPDLERQVNPRFADSEDLVSAGVQTIMPDESFMGEPESFEQAPLSESLRQFEGQLVAFQNKQREELEQAKFDAERKKRMANFKDQTAFFQTLGNSFLKNWYAMAPQRYGAAVKTVGETLRRTEEAEQRRKGIITDPLQESIRTDLKDMGPVEFIGSIIQSQGVENEAGWNADFPIYVPQDVDEIRRSHLFTDTVNWVGFTLGDGIASIMQMGAGAVIGGVGGAALSSWGLNAGDTRQELEKAGVTDEATIQQYTYGIGTTVAALDLMGFKGITSVLSENAKRQLGKSMIARFASGTLQGGIREGITEALQEGVQHLGVAHAVSGEVDLSDPKLWSRMKNALAAGAVVGGSVQGSLSAVSKPQQTLSEIIEEGKKAQAEAQPTSIGDVAGRAEQRTEQEGQVAPEDVVEPEVAQPLTTEQVIENPELATEEMKDTLDMLSSADNLNRQLAAEQLLGQQVEEYNQSIQEQQQVQEEAAPEVTPEEILEVAGMSQGRAQVPAGIITQNVIRDNPEAAPQEIQDTYNELLATHPGDFEAVGAVEEKLRGQIAAHNESILSQMGPEEAAAAREQIGSTQRTPAKIGERSSVYARRRQTGSLPERLGQITDRASETLRAVSILQNMESRQAAAELLTLFPPARRAKLQETVKGMTEPQVKNLIEAVRNNILAEINRAGSSRGATQAGVGRWVAVQESIGQLNEQTAQNVRSSFNSTVSRIVSELSQPVVATEKEQAAIDEINAIKESVSGARNFADVVADLKRRDLYTNAEVYNIAKAIAPTKRKFSSRKKAIEHLERNMSALEDFKARSEAMKGRSAAMTVSEADQLLNDMASLLETDVANQLRTYTADLTAKQKKDLANRLMGELETAINAVSPTQETTQQPTEFSDVILNNVQDKRYFQRFFERLNKTALNKAKRSFSDAIFKVVSKRIGSRYFEYNPVQATNKAEEAEIRSKLETLNVEQLIDVAKTHDYAREFRVTGEGVTKEYLVDSIMKAGTRRRDDFNAQKAMKISPDRDIMNSYLSLLPKRERAETLKSFWILSDSNIREINTSIEEAIRFEAQKVLTTLKDVQNNPFTEENLREFGGRVNELVKSDKKGQLAYLIVDAYYRYKMTYSDAGAVEVFKSRLLEAHKKGYIQLDKGQRAAGDTSPKFAESVIDKSPEGFDVIIRDFTPEVQPKLDKPAVPSKVVDMSQALVDNRDNPEVFNEVVTKLKKRGFVSKEELTEIANGYLGTTAKYKTKKAAIEAIENVLPQQNIAGMMEGQAAKDISDEIMDQAGIAREDVAPFQPGQTAGMRDDLGFTPESEGVDLPSANLFEMMENLKETLGMITRQGRMSLSQALGQYDRNTGVERQRVASDYRVLAHEAGHHIESHLRKRTGNSGLETIKERYRDELIPLATAGHPLDEGFAEFFRRYLTNPENALAQAPNFYSAFEVIMEDQHAETFESLKTLQQQYQEFLRAPSGGVMTSRIVNSKKEGFMQWAKSEFWDQPRTAASKYAHEVYRWLLNKNHPIYQAVDGLLEIASDNFDMKRSDLAIKAVDNPFKLAQLLESQYAVGHMDLMYGVRDAHGVDHRGPSLQEALIRAFGGTDRNVWDGQIFDDFGGYLAARRLLQEWYRYRNGQLAEWRDTFTDADLQGAIRDYENHYPQFKDAADMVYEYQQLLLKKQYDAGLLTQEEYQEYSSRDDYVPVYRDMSDQTLVAGDPASVTAIANLDRKPIHQFRGSARAIINPIENIVSNTYLYNSIIMKNNVALALKRLGDSAGIGSGAIVEPIPNEQLSVRTVDPVAVLRSAAQEAGLDSNEAKELLEPIADALGNDVQARIYSMGDINTKGEPIIFYWENGKRGALRLGDGEAGIAVYNAMMGLGQEQSNLVTEVLAAPAAVLRSGITSHPEFIFANLIRDQVSAWILTEDFVPFYDSFRGIYDDFTGGEITRDMNSFGVLMGGANVAALDSVKDQRDAKALRTKGIDMQKRPLRWLLGLTEFSETGTRAGVFDRGVKRAKRLGLTDYEAAVEGAYVARDYIDFGRHGSGTAFLRRTIAFFNAALQGTDRGVRTLAGFENNPTKLKEILAPMFQRQTGGVIKEAEYDKFNLAWKAWTKIAVPVGLFGLALSLYYKDDEEYEEISEYIRATHWVIKVAPGEWVRIPKPFELAIMSNFYERAFEYAYKDDPKAAGRFWRSLGFTMVPPYEPGFNVITQMYFNYDTFRQAPIIPEHEQGLPGELQFNQYSSELAKFLGEKTDTSPAMIDFAVKGLLGSFGRDVLTLSNNVNDNAPKTYWMDYAMIRRFTWRSERGATSAREFWGLVGNTNGKFTEASKGYKAFEKLNNLGGQKRFLDDLDPERRIYALLMNDFKAAQKRFHPLRRARDVAGFAGNIKKQINLDTFENSRTEKPIPLSASKKMHALEILSQYQMIEMRNALVLLEHEGWKQKKFMDAQLVLDELKEAVPEVYDEFMRRHKTRTGRKLVYSFDKVKKKWPEMKKRLLKDGAKAKLLSFR